MSWCSAILMLVGIVLLATALFRKAHQPEDLLEVRFIWNSPIMCEKRIDRNAPPDYEVKLLYKNRDDFCKGCPERGFCRDAVMVYNPHRAGWPWVCLKRGCAK